MSDFAAALAKAKEVAARLSSAQDNNQCEKQNGGVDNIMALKRPAQDNDEAPGEKRAVTDMLSAAAQAAAKINQKMGSTAPTAAPTIGALPVNQDIIVPDHLVGLIIGKKGETIQQLQNDTSCKIQIATEGIRNERNVTLTGSPAQIEHAKRQINELMERGKPPAVGGLTPGTFSIDVMIPGPRAGIIVGKNGETIKNMQESCNVKMVLIQDTPTPGLTDKPLRITGSQSDVQKAKDMVMTLLASRDVPYAKTPSMAGPQDMAIYSVPYDKAGIIIGKGGENVRDISTKSGAHIELNKQGGPDPALKYFHIKGSRNEIDVAVRLIAEKAILPVMPFVAYYPAGTPQPTINNPPVAPYGVPGAPMPQPQATNWQPMFGQPAQQMMPGQQPLPQAPQQQPMAQPQYAGWPQPAYGGQPMPQPNAAPMAVPQQQQQAQPAVAQLDPVSGAAHTSAATQGGAMPPPTVNPITGQMDYSAAWAEYYRRLGMHEHAEMVLKQASVQQAQAQQSVPQVQANQAINQGAPAGHPASMPVQHPSAAINNYGSAAGQNQAAMPTFTPGISQQAQPAAQPTSFSSNDAQAQLGMPAQRPAGPGQQSQAQAMMPLGGVQASQPAVMAQQVPTQGAMLNPQGQAFAQPGYGQPRYGAPAPTDPNQQRAWGPPMNNAPYGVGQQVARGQWGPPQAYSGQPTQ